MRRLKRTAVVVALCSVLPSLAGLLGTAPTAAEGAEPGLARALLHGGVEWSAVAVALAVGFFAAVRWRGSPTPEAALLALTLPAIALLDAAHALAPAVTADPAAAVLTWTLSRAVLAVALSLGLAAALPASSGSWMSRASAVALGLLGTAAVLAAAAALRGALSPALVQRLVAFDGAWNTVILLLLAAAAILVLPQLPRDQPLASALRISMVPQLLCQLELVLGSAEHADLHSQLAHWLRLLAYGTLLAGVAADYSSLMRKRATTEQELDLTTQEIAEIKRRLTAEEHSRQQSEAQHRMLEKAIETMSLGVTITDSEGKILYVNPADARMHGYETGELIGKQARMFAAPGTLAGGQDDSTKVAEPWSRERVDVTREGQMFPVRLVSDRIRDAAGKSVVTVTLCEDISERKRFREALGRRDRILEAVGLAAERFLSETSWGQSVEEVLERLGRAAGVDLIYIHLENEPIPFTPHGLILSWTTPGGSLEESFTQGLGLTERLRAWKARWHDRLDAGRTLVCRAPELPEDDRQLLEDWGVSSLVMVPIFVGSRLLGYLCLEDGDTERRWSPAELEALKIAARTFGASIQRRLVESDLASSEEKYRDLTENANDLIQSISPDGRYLFVNRAWKETLGYGGDEVSRLKVWDVVRSETADADDGFDQSLLSYDGSNRIETVFTTKDGQEITVEGSVSCRYVDGLPVAIRGIFRDITERRLVDRMIQDFISTVSHELRTPLTSIIASLGLLESGRLAHDTERTTELIAIALRNSNRLLQLINNLLDLRRLAADKMTFRLEQLELLPLLQETLDDIRAFADSYKVALALEEETPGLEAVADRERLMQVLDNLLSNAIKFSPAGETVTITVRGTAERAVITVADNGPGIPEEFRSRLFEKFSQVEQGVTRSTGGSGLGLSIARGLVEGMDGAIELAPPTASGTVFHIRLPLAPH